MHARYFTEPSLSPGVGGVETLSLPLAHNLLENGKGSLHHMYQATAVGLQKGKGESCGCPNAQRPAPKSKILKMFSNRKILKWTGVCGELAHGAGLLLPSDLKILWFLPRPKWYTPEFTSVGMLDWELQPRPPEFSFNNKVIVLSFFFFWDGLLWLGWPPKVLHYRHVTCILILATLQKVKQITFNLLLELFWNNPTQWHMPIVTKHLRREDRPLLTYVRVKQLNFGERHSLQ